MCRTGNRFYALVFLYLTFTHPLFVEAESPSTAAARCESVFAGSPNAANLSPSTRPTKQETAKQAAVAFKNYFAAVNKQLVESEYLIELSKLALLANENMLMMGPPGNAKTKLAKSVLGNILNRDGKPSFFARQMTFETSLSDTHGPVNYRALTETGMVTRFYELGMLGYEVAFLDEVFDLRPNAFRNVLEALEERTHSESGQVYKGKTKTTFVASNHYISDIFEMFRGSDHPRALIDRVALVAYVPSEFEYAASYRHVAKNGRTEIALPAFYFDQLEKLSAVVKKVEIPDYIAEFVSLMQYQTKPIAESLEQKAIADYREKLKNGEDPLPPRRSTKYHSKRTLGKAGAILQAVVVNDWIENGGKRSLVATTEDIERMLVFYQLNGPSESAIEVGTRRATFEKEQAELQSILRERQISRQTYQSILKEFNEAIANYGMSDLAIAVHDFKSLDDSSKAELISKLYQLYIQTNLAIASSPDRMIDRRPEHVGLLALHDTATQWLKRVIGGAKFKSVQRALDKAIADIKRGVPVDSALQSLNLQSSTKSQSIDFTKMVPVERASTERDFRKVFAGLSEHDAVETLKKLSGSYTTHQYNQPLYSFDFSTYAMGGNTITSPSDESQGRYIGYDFPGINLPVKSKVFETDDNVVVADADTIAVYDKKRNPFQRITHVRLPNHLKNNILFILIDPDQSDILKIYSHNDPEYRLEVIDFSLTSGGFSDTKLTDSYTSNNSVNWDHIKAIPTKVASEFYLVDVGNNSGGVLKLNVKTNVLDEIYSNHYIGSSYFVGQNDDTSSLLYMWQLDERNFTFTDFFGEPKSFRSQSDLGTVWGAQKLGPYILVGTSKRGVCLFRESDQQLIAEHVNGSLSLAWPHITADGRLRGLSSDSWDSDSTQFFIHISNRTQF